MRTLDEAIKYEEKVVNDCEAQVSRCDMNDLYERDIAFQNIRYAESHQQVWETNKE